MTTPDVHQPQPILDSRITYPDELHRMGGLAGLGVIKF